MGLVELVVMLAVVSIILLTVFQFMGDVDRAWKTAGSDPFAGAEEAFDGIARNLAAATLEPYFDYADAGGAFRTGESVNFVPDHPARRSDLGFACGPASTLLVAAGRNVAGSAVLFFARTGYSATFANTGMEQLLNACGYFVDFGPNEALPPFLAAQGTWRWRLCQIMQPSENIGIFAPPNGTPWWQSILQGNVTLSCLAENVITLIVLPQRSGPGNGEILCPDYRYDSRDASNVVTRNQLPACVRLALVALDETSALRLAARNGTSPPALVRAGLFQQAGQLDADLASLDLALTSQKLGHLILQRTITLPSAAWSEVASR